MRVVCKYWITVNGLGTVYQSDDDVEAEAAFYKWVNETDAEVILFAEINDGFGAGIWLRS